MKLSFSDLVSCTGGKTTYCGEDFSVRDLKFDSRENVENSAFFALITDKDDGHKYVSVAAGKGAVAASLYQKILIHLFQQFLSRIHGKHIKMWRHFIEVSFICRSLQ